MLFRSDGVVPMGFRGYRVRSGGNESHALRATPVLTLLDGRSQVSVAHRRFWQRFPKAFEATPECLSVRLLPGQFPDVHELQGGEQLTEEFVVCFGPDTVTESPLEWVRSPVRVSLPATWLCGAEALPHLTPLGVHDDPDYVARVMSALEGEHS